MTMHNELIQFVGQIPPVTRGICLLMVLVVLIQRLNVLPQHLSDFTWSLKGVVFKFQIWRLFSSFLILQNDAMKACLDLYTVYTKSLHLELVHFRNRSIDYLFYICFNFALIIVLVELCQVSYPILTNAFIGMTVYTWTLDNSNVKVMFYGLFPILGKYLSLVHLFVSFLFDDGKYGYSRFCVTMVGFSAGYVYSCLDTRTYGPLYGYLTGKDPGYGFQAGGYFRAPRWFRAAILWVGGVRSTPKRARRGRGKKLGTGSTPASPDTDHVTTSGWSSERYSHVTSSRSSASSARDAPKRDSASKKTASNGSFKGQGYRLGSLDDASSAQ